MHGEQLVVKHMHSFYRKNAVVVIFICYATQKIH